MKYLVRLSGEIVVKSNKVRSQFINQLTSNIHSACQKLEIDCEIKKTWTRLFVESEDESIPEVLSKVFGIQSFSPVDFTCKSDLEEIKSTGLEFYADKVKGKSFSVKSKRSGKVPFSSLEANAQLGSLLNKGDGTCVNLTTPEVCVLLEIGDDRTCFFHKVIAGPGGLPLGTAGRAVVLMSGGFDSPVAAWMLQKRGVKVDYVFCNIAGSSYERSVLEISKYVFDQWGSGSRSRFYSVDFSSVVENLKANVEPRFLQVILKRLFYRAAKNIAKLTDSDAVITGEAVGQVSSQTLKNLAAIDNVIDLPVLRPLVAFDKNDIIEFARKIGTYDLSAKVTEYCQLTTQKPSVACSVEKAVEQESRLDLNLLEVALSNTLPLDLRRIKMNELAADYVMKNYIPKSAKFIDIRPEDLFDEWHYPGAQNFEAHEVLENMKLLEKGQTYLIYCPYGLQSAVVAEKLQANGYEAYSFEGGVAALKKL